MGIIFSLNVDLLEICEEVLQFLLRNSLPKVLNRQLELDKAKIVHRSILNRQSPN
jgi:hypothetical protein